MRRREFIAGLGGAAAWPLTARAQQPARMPRVGIITGTAEADPQIKSWVVGFMRGLEELGWHPGHNVTLDFRWGQATWPPFAVMRPSSSGSLPMLFSPLAQPRPER